MNEHTLSVYHYALKLNEDRLKLIQSHLSGGQVILTKELEVLKPPHRLKPSKLKEYERVFTHISKKS